MRALVFVALVILLKQHWAKLDGYLSGIEKTAIPELAIGIGAAISGIIAIAFTLSLFAIQQMADKGTAATVQAYSRDPVLAFVYWSLTSLAVGSFIVALLKPDPFYHTVAAVTILTCLLASFVLLNFHFKRVVRFSDPNYTVLRLYKDGQRQLRRLQVLRQSIRPMKSEPKGRTDGPRA